MPPSNTTSILQFFRYLPSEIIIDILSRLPIRTIVICKCVCRSWRHLLCSRYFVDFHHSKSVTGLVIGGGLQKDSSKHFTFYEFSDETGLENHDLHYKPLPKMDSSELFRSSVLLGSTNGLLLLRRRLSKLRYALYICNPITREYIELPNGKLFYSYAPFIHGFGVSRLTEQHKVVRIFHERNNPDRDAHTLSNVTLSICLVYTLGTGMWRSITPPTPFLYHERHVPSFRSDEHTIGVCLNGNLHWLVKALDGSDCISRFDLDAETFSTFYLPLSLNRSDDVVVVGLVVLGDCLCVCDNTSYDEAVIWLMKEYGDVKSWAKEFVIRKSEGCCAYYNIVRPIKVFRDGDILMACHKLFMFYYSSKIKTTAKTSIFGVNETEAYVGGGMEAMHYTPSFLSLTSLVKESVSRL